MLSWVAALFNSRRVSLQVANPRKAKPLVQALVMWPHGSPILAGSLDHNVVFDATVAGRHRRLFGLFPV
jgi:hypothetical protein